MTLTQTGAPAASARISRLPGGAVQEQVVAVAGAGHREDERLAVDLEADGRVQRLVEDRVQHVDVADLLLGQPAHVGARVARGHGADHAGTQQIP